MTLTLHQIATIGSTSALRTLSTQPLPIAGAWKVRRLTRALQPEVDTLKAALLSRMTEENSVAVQGGRKPIDPEKFDAEFAAELGGRTVDVEAEPLTMADLEGARLSAADIEVLAPLIVS
jgi:hypothetical protein